MGTVNSNFLPATSGLSLGSQVQQWNVNGLPYPPITQTPIPVSNFGAKCDGVTDDTAAWQAAVNAANAAYVSSGAPQAITWQGNSVISGSVTIGSGVSIIGKNGVITVPSQVGNTFNFVNADNCLIEGAVINVVAASSGQGPLNCAISWTSTALDNLAHVNFAVRNCIVNNSLWGIQAFYGFPNGGTGSLSNVDISGNTVTSPTVYTRSDGIHCGGRVSGLTISNNRVLNRGDGAISLTSEFVGSTLYVLSGAAISGNVITNCLVGIDISGATNVEVVGNNVNATVAAVGQQNPAFRQIFYPQNANGNYPANVQTHDNYFCSGNNGGATVVAKIDPLIGGQLSWPVLNSTFQNNVIDGVNNPLYIRGNTITVDGNTFMTGGLFNVDYDGSADQVPTENVAIGTNYWMSSGTMQFGGNASLYSNVSLAPQVCLGTLTITNLASIGTQIYTAPGTVVATGSIFAGGTSVTIAALSTPTALVGTLGLYGLLSIRDFTSGGVALFILDPNNSPAQLLGSSNITGMAAAQVTYSSGWKVALSSGSVPRTFTWAIYR